MLKLISAFLWIEILSGAGCSLLRTTSTPPPALTPTKSPTFPSIVMPTLLPVRGSVAFIHLAENGIDHRIFVMNADGSGMKDISPNLSGIGGLAWSPDGRDIAFDAVLDGVRQIYRMKADGSNLEQLTSGEQDSFYPSWSPDGKYIVFTSSNKDILDDRGIVSQQAVVAQQVYIMNSDGTAVRRLMEDDKATMSGLYRNDGFIAVSVPITRHSYTNYIVNSDGIVQKQFPEFTTEVPPVWTPDGRFVLLATVRTDCSGLIVMKPNGSERACPKIDKITTPPTYVGAASWSPDGKYIIFSSNMDGDYDLYIIMPDGSALTQLTNLPGDETGTAWWSAPQ